MCRIYETRLTCWRCQCKNPHQTSQDELFRHQRVHAHIHQRNSCDWNAHQYRMASSLGPNRGRIGLTTTTISTQHICKTHSLTRVLLCKSEVYRVSFSSLEYPQLQIHTVMPDMNLNKTYTARSTGRSNATRVSGGCCCLAHILLGHQVQKESKRNDGDRI